MSAVSIGFIQHVVWTITDLATLLNHLQLSYIDTPVCVRILYEKERAQGSLRAFRSLTAVKRGALRA